MELIFQLDISGKDFKLVQPQNISLISKSLFLFLYIGILGILVKFLQSLKKHEKSCIKQPLIFQLEISGKDINDEQPSSM